MGAAYKLAVRALYKAGHMTAAQVWECVDNKTLTSAEAVSICGPRPEA